MPCLPAGRAPAELYPLEGSIVRRFGSAVIQAGQRRTDHQLGPMIDFYREIDTKVPTRSDAAPLRLPGCCRKESGGRPMLTHAESPSEVSARIVRTLSPAGPSSSNIITPSASICSRPTRTPFCCR